MSIMNSNFVGSSSSSISTTNQELVENGVAYLCFDFYNKQDCIVQINKSENIFLFAGQGFKFSSNLDYIFSFKIVTDNVVFNFIAKK